MRKEFFCVAVILEKMETLHFVVVGDNVIEPVSEVVTYLVGRFITKMVSKKL